MEDADYERFGATEFIPDFESYRKKYHHVKETIEIEDNSTLFVLGNNKQYYFGSMFVKYHGQTAELDKPYVHVGMIQDSVLCQAYIEDYNFDYRYFPYRGYHIEFYSWMDDMDNYILNCGDVPLFVSVYGNVYKIEPNEKKHIVLENNEIEKPQLNYRDLYDVFGN